MKFFHKIFLITSALLSTHLWSAAIETDVVASALEVRYLQPPILQDSNWGEQILCHRPLRLGAPRMEIEMSDQNIIVHNYGHGGSGWTVAPGCARHLVAQCQRLIQTLRLSYNTPIVVLGAGCLGLFSAYELVKAGYSNITIVAEQFDNLVSHKAGGFLAPSTMAVDVDSQSIIDTICYDAYRFYQDIAQGHNADFPACGALILPIYLKRQDTRLEAYEEVVMNRPHEVIIDFGNGKRYDMKVYDDGIFMDTGIMMNALTAFLRDKVQWVQQHVAALDEIVAPCIFNCSGLGAQQINHDDAMVSVQGHLILLEDQNPSDMDYMISFYVDSGVTEHGAPIKRSIYMFPKHVPGSPDRSVGVMGGTFIENATASTPHEQEFDLIIERAREFFGSPVT